MSKFKASYRGIGELLRADFIQADMIARAERVKALAEAIAPVDEQSDHPGRYKASFKVEGGVRRGKRGSRSRRAYGRVVNTAPEAIDVEYGRGAYTTLRATTDDIPIVVRVGPMAAQRVMARALYGAAGA